MPIRQLKGKSDKKNSNKFSTHLFGSTSREEERTTIARKPIKRSDTDAWLSALGGSRNVLPQRPRQSKKIGKKIRKKALFFFFVRAGLILFFLGGIFAVSIFAWYSKDLPDPDKIIERDIAQSTKIYDRTGEVLLYEIHGAERRTLIELSAIPQYAIDATIAIEDKNFFKHGGLSLTGITRAIILETLSKIGLYNKIVPGGSTLTQQFIKNAVLTTEKSYARKIKEFVLAYRLEQKFTKDEVLKLYFNEIPYGSTAYGIETASHIYFDKSASKLTLAEAAILAALPQAPSYYSPYGTHKDELIGRQRYILQLMVEQQYITEEEEQAARDEELVFKKRREDITAPHFVFMVKEELSERYGERLVEQGGLKIITTLDSEKQKIAEEVINEIAPNNFEQYEAQNASLVTIDVETGEVLTLVGSKDFFDDEIQGQVNVATSLRQPGSSLKPVIYAEAFNQGYRPETSVFDLVTSFAASGNEYMPHDYDDKERGPVSLRQALQGSLNIPAVKMLYMVGVGRAVELAQELGYSTLTDPERYGLSLVLGGGEVKLIEHTNAYATFAREGVFKPYVTVLRVEGSKGEVFEEHRDTEGRRALPREVVRTLTNVLSDNSARAFIFGAQNYLTLADRPAVAKTGTTNDYRDAWTIGYTPSIATGVWVGNSRNEAMKQGAAGGVVAAPLWQKYMNTILQGESVESFREPEQVDVCKKPMLCGQAGERVVKINIDTGKLPSPYTPASKIKEVTFNDAHSLLHYVKRRDPTGAVPDDPSRDAQYALWEEPIQEWAEEKGITDTLPPTETDDIYKPEDQPQVSWISPQDQATITTQVSTFSVQALARRGIEKVDYYLNSVRIGTATRAPFNYSFTTSPLTPNGSYTLKAVASDDIGNIETTSIQISINVPRGDSEWSITWETPTAGATYTPATLPAQLELAVTKPQQLKKIDFFYRTGDSSTYVGFEDVQNKTELSHEWKAPPNPGTYQLYLIVTDANGVVYTLPDTEITILEE